MKRIYLITTDRDCGNIIGYVNTLARAKSLVYTHDDTHRDLYYQEIPLIEKPESRSLYEMDLSLGTVIDVAFKTAIANGKASFKTEVDQRDTEDLIESTVRLYFRTKLQDFLKE